MATARSHRAHNALIVALIARAVRAGIELGTQTAVFTFHARHERVYGKLLNMRTVARRQAVARYRGIPCVLMRGDVERCRPRWLPRD